MSVIVESEHPEQPVLETLIGFVFGWVPDEVKDLDQNFLHHSLNAIIKLGLTENYSLESELRFCLNQPRLNVVRSERGQWDLQACPKAENIHLQTKNPCLPM